MEYKVSQIVSHRHKAPGQELEFEIRWEGYSAKHNTFEPLEHIPSANPALILYLTENGLEHLIEELPADRSIDLDEGEWLQQFSNMVSPAEVLLAVNRVIQGWKLPTQLHLYPDPSSPLNLLLHKQHFFVIAEHRGTHYIADGQNWCQQDPKTRREIEKMLNRKLTTIQYEGQRQVNFCGSAAGAIAIKLAQEMRKPGLEKLPKQLDITFRDTLRSIEKKLHKDKKVQLKPGRVSIHLRPRAKMPRVCNKCKESKSRTYSALLAHERLCRV